MEPKTEPTAYTFPTTLGESIKRLAALRVAIERVKTKLKPLEDEESALYDHFLAAFDKDALNGARGSGLTLAVKRSVVPTLKDWAAFFKFASKAKNQDLFQRSVSTPAWRERNDAKVVVPGVEAFTRVTLSVTKEKAK